MNKMDYEQIESSQRQHHNELEHYEAMCNLNIEAEYKLFSMLKPKLYKNGNKWCVLYGEDIQSGIAGFGETPNEAICDWNSAWVNKEGKSNKDI